MLFGLICFASSLVLVEKHEEKSFVSWMRQHNQLYTGSEYQFRLGVFLANKRIVESSRFRSFRVGLNQFATYTPAEYRTLLGLKSSERSTNTYNPNKINKNKKLNLKAEPEAVDWREYGLVLSVQDQGSCGSCWAFSAIAGAEGCWAMLGNPAIKLSEQNLVDCVSGCDGCGGGLRDVAFQYVIDNQHGSFNLEKDYPYTAIDGKCAVLMDKLCGHIHEYDTINDGNEATLKTAVFEYGPCSVGIDAGSFAFQLYQSGVYDDDSCSEYSINHGVCVIGYGNDKESGKDYWIVKNSWGLAWGEQGYIKMFRGRNICGIASRAYPVR